MKIFRKLLITIALSLLLAVYSVDSGKIKNRRQAPVVFTIERIPQYSRKIPMKRHFKPDFIAQL